METSEPGLYGLGCATFTQRLLAVVVAIERYLTGRDPDDIEDIHQSPKIRWADPGRRYGDSTAPIPAHKEARRT